MNASFEQPPSSPSELAAGAVALGVVALITIFGMSTSPPGDVSPSVASAAPPRTVVREPDNVPAEPARPRQPSQSSQPSQDGPARIASGTTLEIPIVTPPPAVSEPQKRVRTADGPSIENSSPAPNCGFTTRPPPSATATQGRRPQRPGLRHSSASGRANRQSAAIGRLTISGSGSTHAAPNQATCDARSVRSGRSMPIAGACARPATPRWIPGVPILACE